MNKPIQPITDKAFLSGYLSDLVAKYPSAKPQQEQLLDFLIAGSNANFMKQHEIAKNTVTERWKEATKNLSFEPSKKSYREKLLDLIDVNIRQFDRDYNRYVENANVEYAHELLQSLQSKQYFVSWQLKTKLCLCKYLSLCHF